MITKATRYGIRFGTMYVADRQHRSLILELLDALDEAEAALERVRTLHQPIQEKHFDYETCFCGVEWPCPTITALDDTEPLGEPDEMRARIAAGLALADQWAAVDGNDQRAATLHAVADRLRVVLGKSGQP